MCLCKETLHFIIIPQAVIRGLDGGTIPIGNSQCSRLLYGKQY